MDPSQRHYKPGQRLPRLKEDPRTNDAELEIKRWNPSNGGYSTNQNADDAFLFAPRSYVPPMPGAGGTWAVQVTGEDSSYDWIPGSASGPRATGTKAKPISTKGSMWIGPNQNDLLSYGEKPTQAEKWARGMIGSPGGLSADSEMSDGGTPPSGGGRRGLALEGNMLYAHEGVKMQKRGRSERDLSPIKVRTLLFRSNISKGTMNMKPDFTKGSVMEAALEYSLPEASNTAPTLSPSLLAEFKPANTKDLSPSRVGSILIPSEGTKLFTNTNRLPFHPKLSTSLPDGRKMGLGGSADANCASDAFFRLLPQLTHADEFSFDTPPDIKTGEQAVQLFSSSGAKEGLILCCNLNPDAEEYNPYNLVIVERNQVYPHFHFVMSQTGVTHMWGGLAYELVPHHQWYREAQIFSILKRLVIFKKNELFHAFRKWRSTVRSVRYKRHCKIISKNLLLLSDTFGPALLNIRRMTLAVCEDTAGAWKRRVDTDTRRVYWTEAKPIRYRAPTERAVEEPDGSELDELSTNTSSPLPSSRNGNSTSSLVPTERGMSSSQIALVQHQVAALKADQAEREAQLSKLGEIDDKVDPAAESMDIAIPSDETLLSIAPVASPLPEAANGEADKGDSASGIVDDVGEDDMDAVFGYDRAKIALLKQPPKHRLLLEEEELPEGGLALQLGNVGQRSDRFQHMSDFNRQRADATHHVQHALQQVVHFVVAQVQSVGSTIQEAVREASVSLSKPTRKAAKEARFKMTGQERNKKDSPSLKHSQEQDKQDAMDAAQWDRQKFKAFVTIADGMVLTQMINLARFSLAIFMDQLFQPRYLGLFSVSACMADDGSRLDSRRSSPSHMSFKPRMSSTNGENLNATTRTAALTGAKEGPVIFSPSAKELAHYLNEACMSILSVAAQGGMGLMHYPEVSSQARELTGNTIANGRTPMTREGRDGTSQALSQRPLAILEMLRQTFDVQRIVQEVDEKLQQQYNIILASPNLQPYVDHEKDYAQLKALHNVDIRTLAPEQMKVDLILLKKWMQSMLSIRITTTFGLVQFDMQRLHAVLLPAVANTYSSMMSSLSSLLTSSVHAFRSLVSTYTDSLRPRPTDLAEFVVFMDGACEHLGEEGSKRKAVMDTRAHLLSLYQILMSVVPRPDSPPRQGLVDPVLGITLPEVTVSVKEARPVHMMWKQTQAEVNKYQAECDSAEAFFKHSSANMTSHLKASLVKFQRDLTTLVNKLRTGTCTTPTARLAEVSSELDGMGYDIESTDSILKQCKTWFKLLSHASVATVLQDVEHIFSIAKRVFEGRQRLWRVLNTWESFMDNMYTTPCTSKNACKLISALESNIQLLQTEVEIITSKHVSPDVMALDTVTLEESKLGIHFSLVLRSWNDMLPYAQRLSQAAIKPRHTQILTTWLKIYNVSPEQPPPKVLLQDKCIVPVEHVSTSNHPTDSTTASDATPQGSAQTSMPIASLLSSVTERDETRELADKVVEVAVGEQHVLQWMNSLQSQLTAMEVEFDPVRTHGAFTMCNVDDLLALISLLEAQLSSIQKSPFFGGVMREFEIVEDLITATATTLEAAGNCQHLWLFLSQLFTRSEAQQCAKAAQAWTPLSTVWRRLVLNAREKTNIVATCEVLHEAKVVEEALKQVLMLFSPLLDRVRAAYPRLFFVGDRVLLEAVALGTEDARGLPPQLLDVCFQGMQAVEVVVDEPLEQSSSADRYLEKQVSMMTGMSSPELPAPLQQVMVAVTGSNGETMDLWQDVDASSLRPLPAVLSDLEVTLRQSVKAHTRACLEACGNMQADKWVASFPFQSVALVDALVWTQSVGSALSRVAQGDRPALRNLFDQTVLRLETMARQLRTAMAHMVFAEALTSAAASFGRNMKDDDDEMGSSMPQVSADVRQGEGLKAGKQAVQGLEMLIGAGVCHRKVVEDLISCGTTSTDSFDWVRQVRHYWDGDADVLYVAFAQTRLPYGFEYVGRPLDVASYALPFSIPGLLAAVNALQTSPIVTLSMGDAHGASELVVAGLADMLGKYHASVMLSSDTSTTVLSRSLVGALATDCWISLDGAQALSVQALSGLAQQLHEIWSSFFYGLPSVLLAGKEVASPWGRAPSADSGAPCSIFVSLPLEIYLAPSRSTAMDVSHAAPAQLSESMRRISRAISLTHVDIALVVEAGLRCMGLRDAIEGARCVASCLKVAAMQLVPRPQYRFDLITARSILIYIRSHWLPTPDPSTTNMSRSQSRSLSRMPSAKRHTSSTAIKDDSSIAATKGNSIAAVDAAMRAVLIGMAHIDDVGVIARLIDQVTSVAPRTTAPPDLPAVAAPLLPYQASSKAASFNIPEPCIKELHNTISKMCASACMAMDARDELEALPPHRHSHTHTKGPSESHIRLPSASLMAAAAKSGNLNSTITSSRSSTPGPMGLAGMGPDMDGLTMGLPTALSSRAGSMNAWDLSPTPSRFSYSNANVTSGVSIAFATPRAVEDPRGGSHDGVSGATRQICKGYMDARLAAARRTRLAQTTVMLHVLLKATGACFLVGVPGIGKTLTWKTLASTWTTQGSKVLASPNVLHLFPEALPPLQALTVAGSLSPHPKHDPLLPIPLTSPYHMAPHLHGLPPGACRGGCGRGEGMDGCEAAAIDAPGASQGPHACDDWLGTLLEGAGLRQPEVQRGGGNGNGSGPASTGHPHMSPMMIVFDGPVGTPTSDALLPLVCGGTNRLKQYGGAGLRGAVAIPEGALVVWETVSLAKLSPAALAMTPVLNINDAVLDSAVLLQDGVVRAIHRVTHNYRSATSLSRTPILIMCSLLDRATEILESTFDLVNDHACDGLGNGHAGTVVTLVEFFGETIKTLDLPPQLADASPIIARAAIFSLYWTLCANVMSPETRTKLDRAMNESAVNAGLASVLPQGKLAGYMLSPKNGAWVPWSETILPKEALSHNTARISTGLSHTYTNPYTGVTSIFCPSAMTACIEHVCSLSMRSGNMPLIVGEVGSGRRSLLRHMLVTTQVYGQSKVDVVQSKLSASSSPEVLQQLLTYQLSHGSRDVIRPPLGRRAVLVVEDLNAAVQSHKPASAEEDGVGYGAACGTIGGRNVSSAAYTRCLEWLRQLLDTQTLIDPSFRRHFVQNVSVAATSTSQHLFSGRRQVPTRMWRHMHPIHLDAAAAADASLAAPRTVAQGVSGPTMLRTFSTTALCSAAADHSIKLMARSRVPELSTASSDQSACVSNALAEALGSLLTNIQGLVSVKLLPQWHFDCVNLMNIMSRLNTSVQQGGSDASWRVQDMVKRFVFEVGREVLPSLGFEQEKDALCKVLMHSMGRELGSMLTGRAMASRGVTPIVSSRPLSQQGGASQVSQLASMWNSCLVNAGDSTELRLQLIGKISPSDLISLLEAARNRQDHNAPSLESSVTPSSSSVQETNSIWFAPLPLLLADLGPHIGRLLDNPPPPATPSSTLRQPCISMYSWLDASKAALHTGALPSPARDADMVEHSPARLAQCEDTLDEWGYANAIPLVARSLLDGGFFSGGHVILCGPDSQLMSHVASMGAMLVQGTQLSLTSSATPRRELLSLISKVLHSISSQSESAIFPPRHGGKSAEVPSFMSPASASGAGDSLYVLTVSDAMAAEDGVMELLQQLLTWPATVVSLLDGGMQGSLAELNSEVEQLLTMRHELATSNSPTADPNKDKSHTAGSSMLQILRNTSIRSKRHTGNFRFDFDSGEENAKDPAPDGVDPAAQKHRKATVMENLMVHKEDENHMEGAYQRVQQGHQDLDWKAKLLTASVHTLVRSLRVMIIASPARAGTIKTRFPALSAALTHVVVAAAPAISEQEELAARYIRDKAPSIAIVDPPVPLPAMCLPPTVPTEETSQADQPPEACQGVHDPATPSPKPGVAEAPVASSGVATPPAAPEGGVEKQNNEEGEGYLEDQVASPTSADTKADAEGKAIPRLMLSEKKAEEGATGDVEAPGESASAAPIGKTAPASENGSGAPKPASPAPPAENIEGNPSTSSSAAAQAAQADTPSSTGSKIAEADASSASASATAAEASDPSTSDSKVAEADAPSSTGSKTAEVDAPSASASATAAEASATSTSDSKAAQADAPSSTGSKTAEADAPSASATATAGAAGTSTPSTSDSPAAGSIESSTPSTSDTSAAVGSIPSTATQPPSRLMTPQQAAAALKIAAESATGTGRPAFIPLNLSKVPGTTRSLTPTGATTASPEAEAEGFDGRYDGRPEAVEEKSQHNIANISKALVHIHSHAQQVFWHLGLLDRSDALPLSKIVDAVDVLAKLHGSQRKVMKARQASLAVALDKLSNSQKFLSGKGATQQALEGNIAELHISLDDTNKKVATLNSFMARLQAEIKRQEEMMKSTKATVYEVQSIVDGDMDKVQKRYQDAIAEVGGLNEQDLAELRSYQTPPERVKMVMQALAIIFEQPSDWRSAQKLLTEVNPKLHERIMSLDLRSVSVMAAARLMRIVQGPGFNIVEVQQVSMAAKSLCWWAISVSELLKSQKECDMKLEKIKEAEARLAQSNKYSKKLKAEQMIAENELKKLLNVQTRMEDGKAEFEAQIMDSQRSCGNVKRLEEVAVELMSTWKTSLLEVHIKVPQLAGDATLAAACIVYAGILQPSERTEVLMSWRDKLAELHVPVSDWKDFSSFLDHRMFQLLEHVPHDLLAGTLPSWRDGLLMMCLAKRPPLMIDPTREVVNLLRGTDDDLRVFLSIHEADLIEKAVAHVLDGRVVVVDAYGDESEVATLHLLCTEYELAMRTMFVNLVTARHQLYVRLKTDTLIALPHTLHRILTPIRFSLGHDDMHAKIQEAGVGVLSMSKAAELRDVRNSLWTAVERDRSISEEIIFSLAQTKGNVWDKPIMVDATMAKVLQQQEIGRQLPHLQEKVRVIKAMLDPHAGMLEVAHVCHEVLASMAKHDPHLLIPELLFVHYFRSAFKLAIKESQEAKAQKAQSRSQPTSGGSSMMGVKRGAGSSKSPLRSGQVSASGTAAASDYGFGPLSPRPSAPASPSNRSETLSASPSGQGSSIASASTTHAAISPSDAFAALASGLEKGGAGRTSSRTYVNAAATAYGPTDDLMSLMLKHLAALICNVIGRDQARAFRLLVALHRLCDMGGLSSVELQYMVNLVCKGVNGFDPHDLKRQPAVRPTPRVTSAPLGSGQPNKAPAAGQPLGATLAPPSSSASPQPSTRGPGFGASPGTEINMLEMLINQIKSTPGAENEAATIALMKALKPGQPRSGGPTTPPGQPTSMPGGGQPGSTGGPAPGIKAGNGPGADSNAGPMLEGEDAEWAKSVIKNVAWLEKTYPDGVFQGLAKAMQHQPAAWRRALMSESFGYEPPSPPSSTSSSRSATPSRDQKPPEKQSLVAMAEALFKPAASTQTAVLSPSEWCSKYMTKPIHWLLLIATAAPHRLGVAAETLLSSPLLGPQPESSSGERLLVPILSQPPSVPIIVTTLSCEDPLLGIYAAQSCLAASINQMDQPETVDLSSTEVVVYHWNASPGGLCEARAALALAMKLRHWLVILNAHVAPDQISEMLISLSKQDYMVRGEEDAGFRLFLVMPYAALPAMRRSTLQQAVQVCLEPAYSIAPYIHGVMQLLAHPLTAYIGFFDKTVDRDLHLTTFSVALTLATLNQLLTASGASSSLPSHPYGLWDLLHAVHLSRLIVSEAKKFDHEGQNLDYARIQDLLLADVFLPGCPAQHLTGHVIAVVKGLISNTVLTTEYPVHQVCAGEHNLEAGQGPPTEPWPFTPKLSVISTFLRYVIPPASLSLHKLLKCTSGAQAALNCAASSSLALQLAPLSWPLRHREEFLQPLPALRTVFAPTAVRASTCKDSVRAHIMAPLPPAPPSTSFTRTDAHTLITEEATEVVAKLEAAWKAPSQASLLPSASDSPANLGALQAALLGAHEIAHRAVITLTAYVDAAETVKKPRNLGSSLDVLLTDLWCVESRMAMNAAAVSLQQLHQIRSSTALGVDSSDIANVSDCIGRGFVPPEWYAPLSPHPAVARPLANTGLNHPVQMTAWRSALSQRLQLIAAAADGKLVPPTPLNLSSLSIPSSMLAVYMRAYGQEHSVVISNVTCRAAAYMPAASDLNTHTSRQPSGASDQENSSAASTTQDAPVPLQLYPTQTPSASASRAPPANPRLHKCPSGSRLGRQGGDAKKVAPPPATGRHSTTPTRTTNMALSSRPGFVASGMWLHDGSLNAEDQVLMDHPREGDLELSACPLLVIYPGFLDPTKRSSAVPSRAGSRPDSSWRGSGTPSAGASSSGGVAANTGNMMPTVPVPVIFDVRHACMGEAAATIQLETKLGLSTPGSGARTSSFVLSPLVNSDASSELIMRRAVSK